MTEIHGKSILVRASARFELARVRVVGSQLYIYLTTLFLHLIRGPIKWIAALTWSLVNSPTASYFVHENASRNYLNDLTSLA